MSKKEGSLAAVIRCIGTCPEQLKRGGLRETAVRQQNSRSRCQEMKADE